MERGDMSKVEQYRESLVKACSRSEAWRKRIAGHQILVERDEMRCKDVVIVRMKDRTMLLDEILVVVNDEIKADTKRRKVRGFKAKRSSIMAKRIIARG